MQSIGTLADKAMAQRGRFDKSVGLPLLVTKTIQAQGIRDPGDVKRLRTQVLKELSRRSAEKRKAAVTTGVSS